VIISAIVLLKNIIYLCAVVLNTIFMWTFIFIYLTIVALVGIAKVVFSLNFLIWVLFVLLFPFLPFIPVIYFWKKKRWLAITLLLLWLFTVALWAVIFFCIK
jgi:hypothetical protein